MEIACSYAMARLDKHLTLVFDFMIWIITWRMFVLWVLVYCL
jgi:hypothetical protein